MSSPGSSGLTLNSVNASTSEVSNPWANSPALVFLGFQIEWAKRVTDFQMHERLATTWEKEFEGWTVSNRIVDLQSPSDGYFVRLSDGLAHFASESLEAYQHSIAHVPELLASLLASGNEFSTVNIVAQFLDPAAVSFNQLVDHLDEVLVNPRIRDLVNGTTVDVAYLVDMQVDGVWRQINVGAVRPHELRRRVAARTLKVRPDVAIFLSVTTRKPIRYELSDLSSAVCDTERIGREILESIRP